MAAKPYTDDEVEVICWAIFLIQEKRLTYYRAVKHLGAVLGRPPQNVRSKLKRLEADQRAMRHMIDALDQMEPLKPSKHAQPRKRS